MFPAPLDTPAAVLLLLGGFLACFAGYRLFRIVLGIYGGILGALLATQMVAPAATLTLILVAVLGALVGAVVLIIAYFLGVALLGAALGALVTHVVWAQFVGEPHVAVLAVFAVLGALIALILQRFVIIVGTALGGSWTALVGSFALLGYPPPADRPQDAWLTYPLDPAPGYEWVLVAWIILAVTGIVTQVGATAPPRRARIRRSA